MTGAQPAVAPRPRPSLGAYGDVRVWTLALILGLSAIVLLGGAFRDTGAVVALPAVPWLVRVAVLVLLFGLAERFPFNIQFREQTHSFSLSEVPLVLGLFFVSPGELVLAHIGGVVVPLVLHRRNTPIKLAFNLANFALTDLLALLAFRAIVDPAAAISTFGWVAGLVGVSLAHLIQAVTVITAISLAEGRPPRLGQLLGMGTIFTVVNICLGLLAVTIVGADPWASWLLVFPAILVYKTSDAFSRLQQRHENLELLYDATSMIAQSVETDAVVGSLLRQARELVRADQPPGAARSG